MNLLLIKNKKWFRSFTLFLFCMAIILGPAYALFDNYKYDYVANPDVKTYLGLANFDFDQSPVRKYMIIVPFLSSMVHYLAGNIFTRLAPNSFPNPDFSMSFSFFVVNCFFMSLFGVIIFRICKLFEISTLGAIVGLFSVLTCRWTSYFVGIPLVDSLYWVLIASILWSLKTKNTKLMIILILVGPWIKESFIFILPLIFFFSTIPKQKQILLYLVSGVLIFGYRYYFDFVTHTSNIGLSQDFSHVNNIVLSLKKLFSFHGLYEIFSVIGIWGFLYFFLSKELLKKLLTKNRTYFLLIYAAIILVHMLLSTELARMFYGITPLLALGVGASFDNIYSGLYSKKFESKEITR